MNYGFLPDAEADFNEAVEYYEGCQSGLWKKFYHEISKERKHEKVNLY